MKGRSNQLRGARPAQPHTNRKGGYNLGSHLVRCDRSGKIYDAENTRKEWTGLIVGKDEWEPRHPQEFVRGIREDIAVRDARPKQITQADLSTDIDDITAVSGSVVSSVYTSAAISDTRPFVFWTVDLGASYALDRAVITGLAFSGVAPDQISKGVYLDYSTDNVTYSELAAAVLEFDRGVTQAAKTAYISIGQTARYLRLALKKGAGLGFTETLTMTGLTVRKDV